MSGPIVRRYGFPNFEQIFGKRELQHGVDDEAPASETTGETSAAEPPDARAKPGVRSSKPKPEG